MKTYFVTGKSNINEKANMLHLAKEKPCTDNVYFGQQQQILELAVKISQDSIS